MLYWHFHCSDVKKLCGSILEDTWKQKQKSDMDEIIKKIEEILLDAKCSRWVNQMKVDSGL